MCGLVFSTDVGLRDTAPWSSAMDVLRCRGPESHGTDVQTGALAGHRRLEIIGLGAPGNQPYSEHPGDDVLVFNGEIYNYRDLAAEIGVEPNSDTHVLYELLRNRDWTRLARLRGMYAFAYHDAARQQILTGRDPFGIKPLYVLRQPDGHISFASVPAALAHFPGAREPDPVGIAGFLASGYFPAGYSAFANIEKMAPGEIRTWEQKRSGWDYSRRQLDFSAWPHLTIPQALSDSVDAHLVADVPVGVLLSGGVDSTLLAALASQRTEGLRTYSLTNPDHPDIDEAAIARWNAGLLGTTHVEVPVRPSDLAGQIIPIIRSSGEPFADAAYLPLSLLCARVAEDLKVVLAGEGADELFGGYKRYEVEAMQVGWRKVPARAAATILRGLPGYQRQVPTQRVRALAALHAGPGLASHSYLMGSEWDVVRKALPSAAGQAWAAAQARWYALPQDPIAETLPRNRAFDMREWLANVFLEKSDRASMLHSLEVRVPFLDPEVALAAASFVPTDSRKTPLRDELSRLLPEVRLPEAKKGLSVATGELVQLPEIRAVIEEELGSSSGVLGRIGLLDSSAIRARCVHSSSLGFRIATVGIWGDTWLR